MKYLVGVMLVCITTATTLYADPLDAGLGVDRATLSAAQVALRAERLEASLSFALLRFPEAKLAPGRIFDPAIWTHIEAAARDYNLDPMILAGMIFIESYGDADAKSPTGPAGIAQMTKGSARELGLSVGRKTRVGTKSVKKTVWVGKGKSRRQVVRTVQQPVYKTTDERYIPARAIMAMAKRISNRRAWLGGKVDFAIAEYHMGAGRMTGLLSAYFGRTIKVSEVPNEMRDSAVTYGELYWTNTPYHRPAVYREIEELNDVDYSPTYYFRVRQAMRLLAMYRSSPAEYARLASMYGGRFGYTVLPSYQWSFITEPATNAAPTASTTPVLHTDAAERYVLFPEMASTFGVRAGVTAMTAERSTIGSALFLAHHLKRLQGDRYTGFEIARMLPPSVACTAPVPLTQDDEDDDCAPMHTRGWAFDVPSKNMSKTEVRDLKFILTDLRQAGLLAYVEDGKQPTYHVVRHPDHAALFEQFYWDAMAGSRRPQPPRVAASFAPGMSRDERVSGTEPQSTVFLIISSLLSRIYSYFA